MAEHVLTFHVKLPEEAVRMLYDFCTKAEMSRDEAVVAGVYHLLGSWLSDQLKEEMERGQ